MQDPPARILPSKVNQWNFVDRLLAELYSERRSVKDLWCSLGITRARFEALISECRDDLARNGVMLHTATVSQASAKSRYITADGRRVAAVSRPGPLGAPVAGDAQVALDQVALDQVAGLTCPGCGGALSTITHYIDGGPVCPVCFDTFDEMPIAGDDLVVEAAPVAGLPCPCCGRLHDVSGLISGDLLWCSCGAWLPVRHPARVVAEAA